MNLCLHVLLVISATFLLKADGHNNNYDILGKDLKKYVELAFTPAYKVYKNGHLNFERIIDKPVIEQRKVIITILFKATNCKKPTSDSGRKHNKDCRFKDKPFINCRVCSDDVTSTEPSIDCAFQTDVKAGKRRDIRAELCDFSGPSAGGGSVLSVVEKDKQPQMGCLGCF